MHFYFSFPFSAKKKIAVFSPHIISHSTDARKKMYMQKEDSIAHTQLGHHHFFLPHTFTHFSVSNEKSQHIQPFIHTERLLHIHRFLCSHRADSLSHVMCLKKLWFPVWKRCDEFFLSFSLCSTEQRIARRRIWKLSASMRYIGMLVKTKKKLYEIGTGSVESSCALVSTQSPYNILLYTHRGYISAWWFDFSASNWARLNFLRRRWKFEENCTEHCWLQIITNFPNRTLNSSLFFFLAE